VTPVTVVMTENQMVEGLLDAFAATGWRAWHVRRSDRALWQGDPGWPDITALPKPNANGLQGPLLAIEVKGANGRLSDHQAAWLFRLTAAGVTAVVIRPDDYDRALYLVMQGDSRMKSWQWAFHP
jgi:VRR-NUC domain